MRIIGGTLGGRRLAAVPGSATRPTADRVREALFSRLESRFGLNGGSVLDLFAGTGALAIEALSRGCGRVVCVECARPATVVLRRNLVSMGLDQRAWVLAEDWKPALARLARRGRRFRGVFVDPPYRQGLAQRVLGGSDLAALLLPGAWVSVEAAREEVLAVSDQRLVKVREDCYGDTKLALYERAGDRWEESK